MYKITIKKNGKQQTFQVENLQSEEAEILLNQSCEEIKIEKVKSLTKTFINKNRA